MKIPYLKFLKKSVWALWEVVLVSAHVYYFTVIVLEFYCPFYCLVSRHHAILLQQFTVARAEGHTLTQYPEILVPSENYMMLLF